ncbi:hypothetical protein [Paenibacillus oralis]|uniref:hypothetical protein n=1 Tax=Paenibacillus oralis TaxID=2490856 RepID=UPI0015B163DF|nr:hypothetical protein [Paenibacillus oralis]
MKLSRREVLNCLKAGDNFFSPISDTEVYRLLSWLAESLGFVRTSNLTELPTYVLNSVTPTQRHRVDVCVGCISKGQHFPAFHEFYDFIQDNKLGNLATFTNEELVIVKYLTSLLMNSIESGTNHSHDDKPVKVTPYTWDRYTSYKKLNQSMDKVKILFQIRDAINAADQNNEERLTITFNKTSDIKWILGLAGGLHFWWVIDFVIERNNNTIALLYRNCRIHGKSIPVSLWEDQLMDARVPINS